MIFYYPGYINRDPDSGSQVRLNSVLAYFEKKNWCSINGSFINRQIKLLRLIKSKKQKTIYFETASYPFFLSTKKYFPITMALEIFILYLVSKYSCLHVYYRDAHWDFPQFRAAVRSPTKFYILRICYIVEKYLLIKFANRIYVPSHSFGSKIFDFVDTHPLPPAICKYNYALYRESRRADLQTSNDIVYVGGISNELYDITENIKSLSLLPNLKILVISREEEINKFQHLSEVSILLKSMSNKQFETESRNYTFFLCAFADNIYMNMSLPIKLFKCLELGLVPLYSGSGETAKLLKKYEIGLNLDLGEFTKYLKKNTEEQLTYLEDQREKIDHFVTENSWEYRFKSVQNKI